MADKKQTESPANGTILDLREYNLESFTICLSDGSSYTMRELSMDDMQEFTRYSQQYKEYSEMKTVEAVAKTDDVAIDHICYMFPGLTRDKLISLAPVVMIGKLYWEMRGKALSLDRLKKKG